MDPSLRWGLRRVKNWGSGISDCPRYAMLRTAALAAPGPETKYRRADDSIKTKTGLAATESKSGTGLEPKSGMVNTWPEFTSASWRNTNFPMRVYWLEGEAQFALSITV